MKALLFEKNGFIRPIGLVIIFILLGVCCCTEYMFAQEPEKDENKITDHFKLKEVVIVHHGFKLPPRMVINPIEPQVDVNLFATNLLYWNKDRYDNLANLLAKRQKVMDESAKVKTIVGSISTEDDEPVTPEYNIRRENSILKSIGKSGIQRDKK